eukprot:GHVP01002401.1.p1 GENE.GHVP01002401.1~~GHVP01002401.1.p1  ORF type:complete len:674 (+),score=118.83 GHVP01002401.1:936-2957(+)
MCSRQFENNLYVKILGISQPYLNPAQESQKSSWFRIATLVSEIPEIQISYVVPVSWDLEANMRIEEWEEKAAELCVKNIQEQKHYHILCQEHALSLVLTSNRSKFIILKIQPCQSGNRILNDIGGSSSSGNCLRILSQINVKLLRPKSFSRRCGIFLVRIATSRKSQKDVLLFLHHFGTFEFTSGESWSIGKSFTLFNVLSIEYYGEIVCMAAVHIPNQIMFHFQEISQLIDESLPPTLVQDHNDNTNFIKSFYNQCFPISSQFGIFLCVQHQLLAAVCLHDRKFQDPDHHRILPATCNTSKLVSYFHFLWTGCDPARIPNQIFWKLFSCDQEISEINFGISSPSTAKQFFLSRKYRKLSFKHQKMEITTANLVMIKDGKSDFFGFCSKQRFVFLEDMWCCMKFSETFSETPFKESLPMIEISSLEIPKFPHNNFSHVIICWDYPRSEASQHLVIGCLWCCQTNSSLGQPGISVAIPKMTRSLFSEERSILGISCAQFDDCSENLIFNIRNSDIPIAMSFSVQEAVEMFGSKISNFENWLCSNFKKIKLNEILIECICEIPLDISDKSQRIVHFNKAIKVNDGSKATYLSCRHKLSFPIFLPLECGILSEQILLIPNQCEVEIHQLEVRNSNFLDFELSSSWNNSCKMLFESVEKELSEFSTIHKNQWYLLSL